MQPADRAWLTLGAGVVAWDALCPRGEMLSEASARYTETHRVAWTAAVVYFAGHLLHVWGERDPLTRLAAKLGR